MRRAGRSHDIDLSGRWYAIWQTTLHGEPNINTEALTLPQAKARVIIENDAVREENKVGGYQGHGEATLYDNQHLIGSYSARQPNVVSKGSLYFVLMRGGDSLEGMWVGCNPDSELSCGIGVICKERGAGLQRMARTLQERKGVAHGTPNHPANQPALVAARKRKEGRP